MAIVHKLRYNSTDLDLNDTSTGIGVEPGWIPAESMPTGDGTIPPYVQERIPVLIDASSGDNLASQRQTLAYYQKLAAEYWVDPTQDTPVWYHIKLDDETGERRALVKSIEFQPAQSYIDIGMGSPGSVKGTLIIERHPYWERTSQRYFDGVDPVTAGASISYDYTTYGPHDIVGDVAARVGSFKIGSPTSGANLDRFWIGLRSENKHPSLSDFQLIWECEDGTNNASESGITDDTTSDVNGASPGSGSGAYVEVVETDLEWDDTWQEVLTISIEDIISLPSSSELEANYGNFLWLARTKVTAGEWQIKLGFGYEDISAFAFSDPVVVDSTSWDYYDAAIGALPPRDIQAGDPLGLILNDRRLAIQIQARRTSGEGDLHLDCLCPIPLDEGFLIVSGANLVSGASLTADAYFYYTPHDRPSMVARSDVGIGATRYTQLPEFSAHNFRLPPGDGRMIIVYARASSSVLTDTMTVARGDRYGYWERWLSLRGAE